MGIFNFQNGNFSIPLPEVSTISNRLSNAQVNNCEFSTGMNFQIHYFQKKVQEHLRPVTDHIDLRSKREDDQKENMPVHFEHG